MLYRFHVFVQAPLPGQPGGENRAASPALAQPLGVTWEFAMAALEGLPRMFCEPDGSFVWRGECSPAWQVEGQLFERGDWLVYVELKGSCPALEFDTLLRAWGWPGQTLEFQLAREAVFLDEADFRRQALLQTHVPGAVD